MDGQIAILLLTSVEILDGFCTLKNTVTITVGRISQISRAKL